jgi:hypothetical protein
MSNGDHRQSNLQFWKLPANRWFRSDVRSNTCTTLEQVFEENKHPPEQLFDGVSRSARDTPFEHLFEAGRNWR